MAGDDDIVGTAIAYTKTRTTMATAYTLPKPPLKMLLLAYLLLRIQLVEAATPEYPKMACDARTKKCTTNGGYCIYNCDPMDPGPAYFAYGAIGDGSKCHAETVSKRQIANATLVDTKSTRIQQRAPQGSFDQFAGQSILPHDLCIASCDRTTMSWEECPDGTSGAARNRRCNQVVKVLVPLAAILLFLVLK